MKTHEQLVWEYLCLTAEGRVNYRGPLSVIRIAGTEKIMLIGGK